MAQIVDSQASIPALMRAARGSYAKAIGVELESAGFDDMPRNGGFLLGGMANHGGSAVDMVRGLGVSKQAASQLIDTLVLRGYLTREVDPQDRRRIVVALTERGRAVAKAVAAGVKKIDKELARRITPEELLGLRNGLMALADIKRKEQSDPHLIT
jgi:DNA-binding MarR family transcriptional regulator